MLKKPIVNYSGNISELTVGDFLYTSRTLVQKYQAVPNVTTFYNERFVAPTTVGTVNSRAINTTNFVTRTFRTAYVSTATAGTFAQMYWTTALYTIGTGTNGGFYYSCRFNVSDASAVAGARMFVGMSSSVAVATNVEPNTLLNCIGLAKLSSDTTQWYIVRGGSTAQTAIPLGTELGAPNITTNLFELVLFASHLNSNVTYVVTNVSTLVSVTGTLKATTAGVQLPLSTTLLAPRIWRTNNATASAVAFDFSSLIIEQHI